MNRHACRTESTIMSPNQQKQLNDNQRGTLLRIARAAVEGEVADRPVNLPKPSDPALIRPCGAFVSLHVQEKLRGCIGTFQSDQPLFRTVHDVAISATRDPRFLQKPLTGSEFEHLNIEISALSPLQKTDDPLSLELGIHGIYITRGFSSGCFLPQVASDMNWTKEQFLSYCCSNKAGLSADAWQDPKTKVLLFTAEVFSEAPIS